MVDMEQRCDEHKNVILPTRFKHAMDSTETLDTSPAAIFDSSNYIIVAIIL